MPHAASTALAASIFVNAGILIVYIINLLFAQRILRALQPKIGWSRALSIAFKILYGLIAISLLLIIVFIVYGSYTLGPSFHNAQLWVLRAITLYLLIFVALPLVIVPLAILLPRPNNAEHFGEGSMNLKAAIVMTSAALCTILAGFRAGTTWEPARPISNPAWYHSKAAFYGFNFTIEILVLSLYTYATRPDKHFHVPNGSSKRRSYAVPERLGSESGDERPENDIEKRGSEV
ncbi:uncharacterized protein LTR77_006444 [Saxophila tyrrhenica]|uniref:Uncharacterized protein n=1 Tax=Saxophila tyrrhenica TaxID=1690608 RepID=A0AAV9PC52_9PEZI|nr:hypothetical protein LTR77_006444 [Saxophila tyrrhenica]